jgi:hypothetical protein
MSKKAKNAAIATVNGEIDMTQTNEFIETLSPALRDVVNDLEQLFSEIQETSLRAFWRIGQMINDVKSNPDDYLTAEQRAHGTDAASLLIGVFAPIYTAEQLRGAMSFYESYPSPADVTRLIQLRCPNRPRWRMTVSHVQVLTQVHDPDQRETLEQKCAEDAYTARNLALELQEIRGKQKNSGRAHRSPRGLKQQLLDLLEHQRRFIGRSEKLWLAEDAEETVYDTLINTAPDQLDPAIASYFHEITDNFNAMLSLITIHRRLCDRINQELFSEEDAATNDDTSDTED